ncbi:hypothetical protein BCR35DRAFT_305856 [Leucosporidium creatinivorum]|uniref:F-box domain-containing protein n=1 Tax=Leucosporidium creatinivorum TaxID=106004 RepID=A0A1Y2EYA3_9BASI|nr:hypothetical protein BCR35DRAFT_305856 [Leucosporidium creatinivorum]
MAVIQDLPPEILLRVLELPIGDEEAYGSRDTRKRLARTALVARSWRAPSQRLLALTFTMSSADPVWERYLEMLYVAGGDRFKCIKRLDAYIVGQGSRRLELAAALPLILNLLEQNKVDLQGLHLASEDRGVVLVLSTAKHARLLLGLRSLGLSGMLEVDDKFILPSPMVSLHTLRLYSRLRKLPPFLLPLSTVAPRLTRLELHCGEGPLKSTFDDPLQQIAPHLTYLMLQLPLFGGETRSEIVSSLEPFFSACTTLTTLRIDGPVGPPDLKLILSCLSFPLTLLDVSGLVLRWLGDDRMPKEVGEAFDLPSMAQLRRWRMMKTTYFQIEEMDGRAGREWRAACRARGIEPRGAERYVTD